MNHDDLPEGVRLLGHAVGHAAAMYGNPVSDYEPLIRTAVHGRHEAPGRHFVAGYLTGRARELIAESDSNQCLASPAAAGTWIGAATEILRELIRDA